MNWLDLHMHSVISDDGEFEPEKLMDMCREAGLKTVALRTITAPKLLDGCRQGQKRRSSADPRSRAGLLHTGQGTAYSGIRH